MAKSAQQSGPLADKPQNKTSEPWLVREIVADFVIAPLVRGVIWLFLHLALAIKIAFIKVFLS